LKVSKPTLCGAIHCVCKTDMWAAKDGAPTFCVGDECEGWDFVNPPFAAHSVAYVKRRCEPQRMGHPRCGGGRCGYGRFSEGRFKEAQKKQLDLAFSMEWRHHKSIGKVAVHVQVRGDFLKV
jgi:hypothetical protein